MIVTMNFDFYLIMKFGGAALFIFAGAFFVTRRLNLPYLQVVLVNTAAVGAGFLCSRLWAIAQKLFGHEPHRFYSWQSEWNLAGSVLYGWMLGGVIVFVAASKALRKSTVSYLDIMTPFALIGQVLNRLGCYEAGCCYGKRMGMAAYQKLSAPLREAFGPNPIHPVQLYEAVGDLVLLGLILAVLSGGKAQNRQGQASLIYFAGYAVLRFFMETLRGDNKPAWLGLTVAQIASVLIIAAIVFFSIIRRFNHRKHSLTPR